jgi:lysine-specific demethylase 3
MLSWVLVFQEAMMKDTLERSSSLNFNFKSYLQNAYIHPVFKGDDDDDDCAEYLSEKLETDSDSVLVPTVRQSQRNMPAIRSRSSSPALSDEDRTVEPEV